eukprot:PhM_4_TR3354/c0_g1_i1/m.581
MLSRRFSSRQTLQYLQDRWEVFLVKRGGIRSFFADPERGSRLVGALSFPFFLFAFTIGSRYTERRAKDILADMQELLETEEQIVMGKPMNTTTMAIHKNRLRQKREDEEEEKKK